MIKTEKVNRGRFRKRGCGPTIGAICCSDVSVAGEGESVCGYLALLVHRPCVCRRAFFGCLRSCRGREDPCRWTSRGRLKPPLLLASSSHRPPVSPRKLPPDASETRENGPAQFCSQLSEQISFFEAVRKIASGDRADLSVISKDRVSLAVMGGAGSQHRLPASHRTRPLPDHSDSRPET